MGSDLKTAYSFFDDDGNPKIEEWLFDLQCNSIKKIKKYQTWIKKYELNKDDILDVDYFFSLTPNKYLTKINSIVSKKDSNRKNFYSFKEVINYIKDQMLNNFLSLEEIIDAFYNSTKKQIEKYNIIENKFPENIVTYSNYLNKLFYAKKPEYNPDCIFNKDNLKLLHIHYLSDCLFYLTEILKQDIFSYTRTFHKDIYVVVKDNKILKIFDLKINKKIDRILYDSDENVNNFVDEALKELLKK